MNATSFHPNSEQLISCAKDYTLKVLDVTTGTQIYSSTLEEEPTSLLWCGMELLLVGDEKGYLHSWDMRGVFVVGKFQCHNGEKM